jgi:hypothetical protein
MTRTIPLFIVITAWAWPNFYVKNCILAIKHHILCWCIRYGYHLSKVFFTFPIEDTFTFPIEDTATGIWIRVRFVESTPRWTLPTSVANPECLCRIQIFPIQDPNFISIPDPHQRIFQKIVSKLSEIWSGFFIPDPDFLPPIPDLGVKKAQDPGSGSATLLPYQRRSTAVLKQMNFTRTGFG